jgi:hypothetical protein
VTPFGDGGFVLGDLAKAVAYAKAPKLTFAMLHPKEAVQLRKVPFDLRTAYAPRLAALAALLVAFPLGVVVGMRIARGSEPRQLAPRADSHPARRGARRRPRRGSRRTNAAAAVRRAPHRFVSPPVETEPPPTFV